MKSFRESSINGGLSIAVSGFGRVEQPKVQESRGEATDFCINKIVSISFQSMLTRTIEVSIMT